MSPDPTLHTHLSDPSLTPLLTSARTPPTLSTLSTLTSTALTAHSTSLRLDMGAPRRLMVEYPDGLVLASYLKPEGQAAHPAGEGGENGEREAEGGQQREREGSEDEGNDPPMLVGIVSAPAGEGAEARRVAARLENVGKQFQREWAAEGRRSGEGQ